MFQVGNLIHYEDDDPVFDTEEKAIGYAVKGFEFFDFPIGIWEKESGDLLHIYHGAMLFSP